MSKYVIMADSACDIKPELLEKWGIKYAELKFSFENSDAQYSDAEISSKTFYDKMRGGVVAKTSAVNVDGFRNLFESELINGVDILYLGFSSGLSTTFNSARIAADELMAEYPERKIICADTLSASAGFGLLLYLTVKKKISGASIDEVARFVLDTRMRICHWFTVDDLVYLKRGGRISPTVAFVGGILGIKPVLHMDNEGHLINVSKARGRKAALKALVDKYTELALNPSNGTVFISHADCKDDALAVKAMLNERHKADVQMITDIGPVIGAHSGPGTVALFFEGKER
ncbi:MAG: DegV family protein [Ruminococcus sp.]|nr:DegV family protein [Oscillospiraceae bacterium]